MNIAVYPGSFDPITLGHLDIIRRAAACFDKVLVCVMVNCEKSHPMFAPQERLALIRQSVADIPNVEVEQWSGLLADYARQKGAHIIVKGVRNTADFDSEVQMARINAGIMPGLETVRQRGADGTHQRRHHAGAGDGAAQRQPPVHPFQLHHGAGNGPVRAADGTIRPCPGGSGIEPTKGELTDGRERCAAAAGYALRYD